MANLDDLIRKYYGSVSIGEKALDTAIREFLAQRPGKLLDAGCGEDAPFTRRFSPEAWTTGIDLCPVRPANLPLVQGDLGKLPYTDNTFSIVFSRSVFEHLAEPEQVMREIHRVLKPGGVCIILTPNRYDYSSVAANLTPYWFHAWFVKRVYGSETYDTFPTLYRANTPSYFRRLAANGKGWKVLRLTGLRHYPANLTFSRTLFRIGVLYDWLIARLELNGLQPSLLVVLEKA